MCIIEWAEKIEKMLPKEIIVLDIESGEDIDKRRISIGGTGQRYKEVLREMEID